MKTCVTTKAVKKALWRLYFWGRKEEPITLGYVIASASDMRWMRADCRYCADIIKRF